MRRAKQAGGQQGTKLRSEGHRPACVRIRSPCQVEGLDAQRIPREQEPALLRIPAGEGEHAAQPTHRARPVQAERAQHDGGVAGGLELLPLGHQAPPQVAEIIDLAVEDHHVPSHRVDHGLVTSGGEVENGEPAERQQRAPAAGVRRRDPRPAGVRATVDHRVAHSLQRGAVAFVQSSNDPSNATHRLGPSRKQDIDHIFFSPSPRPARRRAPDRPRGERSGSLGAGARQFLQRPPSSFRNYESQSLTAELLVTSAQIL